jgi:uncharacterized protein (DUF1800 family)
MIKSSVNLPSGSSASGAPAFSTPPWGGLMSLPRRQALKAARQLTLNCVALGLPALVTRSAWAASAEVLKLPKASRSLSAEQIAAHLLNRLGFGPRPNEIATVGSNPLGWIQGQLAPGSLALPETLSARLDEASFLKRHPLQLVQEFRGLQRTQADAAGSFASNGAQVSAQMQAMIGAGELNQSAPLSPAQTPQAASPVGRFVSGIARPAMESRLLRALESPRQLEEVMVDFWFNHFNVFQGKNILRVMIGHYEHYAIRPFAMGRFRDLLGATARHPAMLYYLDNAMSVAPGTTGGGGGVNRGLNENYARELMELHTLGVDGGYRQKDVTELARMLTGWSIQPPNRIANFDTQSAPGNIEQMPGFWFNERVHDQGEKEWLGQRVPAQGQREGEFALDVLARHPATAKHIAFKLAQYFVNDQPSPALVAKLAQVFIDNDGAIVPVLSSLFTHEAFWAKENIGVKFKTPYQYVLSTVRALGATPANLQTLSGAMATQGMPLYGCPTPDGYRNTEAAWLNPDGMTKRINFATTLTSARMGLSIPTEALISHLGPLVSEATKVLARETANDPALASALVLAGPSMMHR